VLRRSLGVGGRREGKRGQEQDGEEFHCMWHG
jgi:hypothetical protein